MATRPLLGPAPLLLAAVCGCVAANSFDRLRVADQTLFHRCQEPISQSLCQQPSDEASKKSCLGAAANSYGAVLSKKERRRWLVSSGCSEAVLDDREALALAGKPEPAGAAPPAVSPPAESLALAGAGALESAVAGAEPPAPDEEPSPPPTIAPIDEPSPPPASLAASALSPSPAPTALPLAKVSGPPGPRLQSGEARERQLRQSVVAHQPQMKVCVDRQLKLHPALRATGTLVIEVDPRGQIVGIAVKGGPLAGTPLESCLQESAVRWQFPASGASYAVEAPLKVTGSE